MKKDEKKKKAVTEKKAVTKKSDAKKTEQIKYIKPKKRGNPGKHNAKTIEEIKTALKSCMGFYTIAAEKLGVSGSAIKQRIDRSPELQEFIKELETRNVQFTETKLMKNIDSGNVAAQIFYLKCKGGYKEQQGIELSQKEGTTWRIERVVVKKD